MSDKIEAAIKQGYGAVARAGLSSKQAGIHHIAKAFGYSAEELAAIPSEANMGLSCGNPVAMASIKPGETVVDLGSGGGMDVFLAAKKVGTGHCRFFQPAKKACSRVEGEISANAWCSLWLKK